MRSRPRAAADGDGRRPSTPAAIPHEATPHEATPHGATPHDAVSQDAVPQDAVPQDADAALRVLYAAHWGRLVRLAAVLLGSTSAAEEVVQDAFVSMYRRWHRLQDPEAAGAYLRASVVNGCRSAYRHRTVEERHRPAAPPEPAGPEERATQRDDDAAVLAALRRLPARQQEVLVLRYYLDASEAEIADLVGISRGSVKTHAHRGIAALRSSLAGVGGTA